MQMVRPSSSVDQSTPSHTIPRWNFAGTVNRNHQQITTNKGVLVLLCLLFYA